jgi:hypothetical protein
MPGKILNRSLTARAANSKGGVASPLLINGAPATLDAGTEAREADSRLSNAIEQRLRLVNDATGNNTAVLAELQALATLDVELGAELDDADISTEILNDIRPDGQITKTVVIREFADPVAPFDTIEGNNDRVPLMSSPIPEADIVTIIDTGVGFKDSRSNRLYNSLFDFRRITRGAARGYVDRRNAEIIAPIIAATYSGGNAVAASTTGTTWAEKCRNTLDTALDALDNLTYKLTGQSAGDLRGEYKLLLPSANFRSVDPIIRGYLSPSDTMQVMPLPISTIQWNGYYNGGFTWGKKTLPTGKFTANTCYLFKKIPPALLGAVRIIAEDLAYITGTASVLEGGEREDAWFHSAGTFLKYFLPKAAGDGLIVKVTLPTKS